MPPEYVSGGARNSLFVPLYQQPTTSWEVLYPCDCSNREFLTRSRCANTTEPLSLPDPMILFLLFGPPLAYLLSLAITGSRSISIIVYSIRGIATWIVSYLLYLILKSAVPLDFEPSRLYAYFAFHDFGFWLVTGGAGYFVSKLFGEHRYDTASFHEIGAFIIGFLLLQPVFDLIEFHRNLDPYLLFALPLLRCAAVFAIPSFAVLSIDKAIAIRGLFALCVPVLVFLSPLVPYFREQSQILLSLLLSAIVLTGSITPFLFARRDAL